MRDENVLVTSHYLFITEPTFELWADVWDGAILWCTSKCDVFVMHRLPLFMEIYCFKINFNK